MEYSKDELKQFERELETYKVTKNIQGKDYTFYNEEQYMKDNNALSKNGAVIIGNDRPIKYEILKDKFQQLYKLQGRREYAQKMHEKELEENLEN